MVRQRPRRAQQTPWQARVGRVAVPSILAGLATTGIVAVATGATVSPQVGAVPAVAAPSVSAAPSAGSTPQALLREQRTNRSQARAALASPAAKAEPKKKAAAKKKKAPAAPPLTVVDRKYTRVALNVRAAADADSRLLTVLDSGSKVAVTKTVRGPWRFVSYRGKGAWVKNQYLVDAKPKPPAKAPAKAATGSANSSAACAGGSAVERGLTPDAVRVHRAICAAFPSVKSYGGVRADSLPEHPSGRALDAMISNKGTGWAIANYVRANAGRLGVSQVLFDRKIWTVQRGREGWRSFSDRGSATANHEDHVHVTVYGRSGG
jgi:hypothetical protein